MALLRLKSAPFVLIEDDRDKNIIPLLLDIVDNENVPLNLFCYEHPIAQWKEVFKRKPNMNAYKKIDPESFNKYTHTRCSIIIDSINQMVFCLGWKESLKILLKLQRNPNVVKLIVVLHKDCFSQYSILQKHLNHIANAIVSYNLIESTLVSITLKKGGKFFKSIERLSYDEITSTLKSTSVVKESKKSNEEPEQLLPSNLTTFKIEMDQTEKLEKYKLKLPYMSKINDGESKVFYEPDAVDDWDEEDPDEDLDI